MHAVLFTLFLAASLLSAVPQVAPQPSDTASPAASATSSMTHAPTLRDRAQNLVGGVWQCDTVAGNEGTQTYTQNDDGSIELHTELHAGFRTFRVDEAYRFDENRNIWTALTEGGAFSGTAPPWSGYKWVFEGIASQRGQRLPVRMIYFDLGDQALRRDFQSKRDGFWQTYSAETCRRPSN